MEQTDIPKRQRRPIFTDEDLARVKKGLENVKQARLYLQSMTEAGISPMQ